MTNFRLSVPCHPILRVARKLPGGARWGPALLLLLRARDPKISIVTETRWATYQVGRYLYRSLRRRYPLRFTSATGSFACCRVHYTSPHLYFGDPDAVHPSADVVASWWHGSARTPGFQDYIARLPETAARLRYLVTSCRISERNLLAAGVPSEKLIRIPLGVDTALFAPPAADERRAARRELGVPPDRLCVGSFQRDGEQEPKWVKGPDVLLRALELAARHVPLFVLLTGGARGYVKRGLDRLGIPFVHHEAADDAYAAMPRFFRACDCCLIPSREEGGPLSLLEAMAAGVPVVATRCGMSPELIEPGKTGFLADVEDAATLAEGLLRVAEDPDLAVRIAAEAAARVKSYDWERIAEAYDEKIYRRWAAE